MDIPTVLEFLLSVTSWAFVDGKWVAFVVGENGVKSVFVDEKKGNLVVLEENHITEFSNVPFVIERNYAKKDIEA